MLERGAQVEHTEVGVDVGMPVGALVGVDVGVFISGQEQKGRL